MGGKALAFSLMHTDLGEREAVDDQAHFDIGQLGPALHGDCHVMREFGSESIDDRTVPIEKVQGFCHVHIGSHVFQLRADWLGVRGSGGGVPSAMMR